MHKKKTSTLVIVTTFHSCRSKWLACLGFAFSWFVVAPTKIFRKRLLARQPDVVWSNNITHKTTSMANFHKFHLLLSCKWFHGWHVMWAARETPKPAWKWLVYMDGCWAILILIIWDGKSVYYHFSWNKQTFVFFRLLWCFHTLAKRMIDSMPAPSNDSKYSRCLWGVKDPTVQQSIEGHRMQMSWNLQLFIPHQLAFLIALLQLLQIQIVEIGLIHCVMENRSMKAKLCCRPFLHHHSS